MSAAQMLGTGLLCFALALAGYVLPTEWRRYQIRREMREMQRGQDLRKIFDAIERDYPTRGKR